MYQIYFLLQLKALDPADFVRLAAWSPSLVTNNFFRDSEGRRRTRFSFPCSIFRYQNWSKKRNTVTVDEERPTKVGVRINKKMLKMMKEDSKILI